MLIGGGNSGRDIVFAMNQRESGRILKNSNLGPTCVLLLLLSNGCAQDVTRAPSWESATFSGISFTLRRGALLQPGSQWEHPRLILLSSASAEELDGYDQGLVKDGWRVVPKGTRVRIDRLEMEPMDMGSGIEVFATILDSPFKGECVGIGGFFSWLYTDESEQTRRWSYDRDNLAPCAPSTR
jgi:hypothetical protein